MRDDLKQMLVSSARRCESDSFIDGDPVQFPHRYDNAKDIEVSGFISAWMAYGSRKVFLRILDNLHSIMDEAGGPCLYVREGGWQNLPASGDDILYRFYKWSDFRMLCHRLNDIYRRFESLEDLFIPDRPIEEGVYRLCSEFNGVKGIPLPGSTSANKRLYMFLRWMVRKGSPVDFGIWNRVTPAQLLVPVDTHVYFTAKALGLTVRKSADLRTSREITAQMAEIWPDDPALGDFALYGSQVM
ncbi:MAG: TIGR02757 family protein [Bacteroidaceae bacterium]